MANIFVYEDRMWKATEEFTNSGAYRFTLPAGEHLLMCHGAAGGSTYNGYHNLGGVAYGIINMSENTPMHAYVGGNGGDAGSTGFRTGSGGFNGGGDGGRAYQDTSGWKAGAGGGGASDIRIHSAEEFMPVEPYTPELPSGYQRVTYIYTNGNVYFDTGYIAKENTTFVFSVEYETLASSSNAECAILGSQSGQNVDPGWVVWLNSYYDRTPKLGSVYGTMGWDNGVYMLPTNIPSNTQAVYQVDKWGTFVNGHPLCYNSDITGSPESNKSIILCGVRRGTSIMSGRMFTGKVYYFRAFEYENDEQVLKIELIPCVRESDGRVGLYDTCNNTFITYTQYYSQGTAIAGSVTSNYIDPPVVTERYKPSISDEYVQLEYLQSPGGIYFDSGYNANVNTAITFRDTITSGSSNECIFGTQSGTNVNPGWACWQYMNGTSLGLASIYGTMSWNESYLYSTNIPYGYSAFYRVEKDRTFVNLKQLSSYEPSGTPEPDRSLFIMACRRENGLAGYPITGKLYHFRIYEKQADDTYDLIHEFVPCKRVSDDVIGLYDTVADPVTGSHQFLEPISSGNTLTAGPEGNFPIVDYDGAGITASASSVYNEQSLNTRIIVAGGGGGGLTWTNNSVQYDAASNNNFLGYTGIGGGVNGGYREIRTNNVLDRIYATQDSGASFGVGQSGRHSTTNNNYGGGGASGGGGGWFGGYASTTTGQYTQASGGGGSGYILTNSSYIPPDYMEDYQGYQMTKPFMGGGYAESACVRICEPYEIPHAGDVITIYGFGKKQRIDLPPGQYRLKCWGADGGSYYNATCVSRGGYAEGILTLTSPASLFAYVGGSGMYHNMISYAYTHQMRPDLSFNGGGAATLYGQAGPGHYTGFAGGGGTDIRINSDSLYARVIVAGGSGAGAYADQNEPSRGGAGGGLEGAEGIYKSQWAYNNFMTGPGTQTGTPQSTLDVINGGFGYGGNSSGGISQYVSSGGGGGWFGGGTSGRNMTSGSVTTGPAHGGSGYTFTEGSYKPDGYLLTDDYKLTDPILIQGGNNLPIGISKIVIEVISTQIVRVLCRDKYGIKYYDETLNRWKIIPDAELSQELFMEYGSLNMSTDEGLDDNYELLIYDPEDTTSSVLMNVTPNEQTITNETMTDITIRDSSQNLEFDPAVYDINITARRQTLSVGTKITTTFKVKKKQQSDDIAKILYVTYSDGK